MERKVWRRPLTEVQKFEANEYVAACGDSGTTYLFKCDAGGGVSGKVYLEDNGKEGLQTTNGPWHQTGFFPWDGYYEWEADTSLGGYHACGTSHEADSDNSFLNGYYIPYGSQDVTNVIVWRGPYNNNVHCTTNLNQDSWETAKS